MRLVFVHGWALGPEIWDFLAPLLNDVPQARVDLGYFGAPHLPALRTGDILVGHSAGLLWGLRQKRDWAGVVAVNSFARFCLDPQGRGCVKPAALRAMRQSLERDPQGCADTFRRSLGIAPAARAAQKERLMEGLDLLAGFRCGALRWRAAMAGAGRAGRFPRAGRRRPRSRAHFRRRAGAARARRPRPALDGARSSAPATFGTLCSDASEPDSGKNRRGVQCGGENL